MVVGLALRGLGKALLKKGGKKGGDAAKKFLERRRVFGNAAFKSDIVQTVKKGKRILGEFDKSIKKATETQKKQLEMIKNLKKK
jgi:hypothetical protein